MGNLSRKAALGLAAVLTAATATTAVAGVAGAAPATTMASASRAVPVALTAPAVPAAPAGLATPRTPATASAASWSSQMYWPVVRPGDRSVKVVDLQCLLRQSLGIWLPCNTRFDGRTERAVKLFQWRHGIYANGRVGPQTWARLIVTVGYGSRYNLAVLAAQASLRMAYRYPITIDGIFGPRTLAAVKDFQRKYGLDPTGVVGPRTWATMAHYEW